MMGAARHPNLRQVIPAQDGAPPPAGEADNGNWASGTVARQPAVIQSQHGRDSISAEAKSLYRTLLLHGAVSADALGSIERAQMTPERLWSCLEELTDLGLVTVCGGTATAVPYTQALEWLLTAQDAVLEQATEMVRQAQRRLNVLIREGAALGGDGVGTVLTALPGDDPDRVFQAAQTQPVTEVAALHPGARFGDELLAISLRRAALQLADGLTLRVIHQNAALSHPSSVDYFHKIEEMGGQVRFSDVLPFRLLLIDGKTAVCCLMDSGGARETLLFQGSRMLGLLGELFETAWIQAVPLLEASPQPRPAAPASALPSLSGQQQTIVRYLADGATDQAIARQLGITTRTVARRINEIYQLLGVHSRFQAGAMARRRGLI